MTIYCTDCNQAMAWTEDPDKFNAIFNLMKKYHKDHELIKVEYEEKIKNNTRAA